MMKIIVFLLLLLTCCKEESFNEKIREYDYWQLPNCFNGGELIDYKDLSAPTDWGFAYTIRVDSSCVWDVIRMNKMERLNNENNVIYVKNYEKSKGVQVGFYVVLDKQELVFSYLEE